MSFLPTQRPQSSSAMQIDAPQVSLEKANGTLKWSHHHSLLDYARGHANVSLCLQGRELYSPAVDGLDSCFRFFVFTPPRLFPNPSRTSMSLSHGEWEPSALILPTIIHTWPWYITPSQAQRRGAHRRVQSTSCSNAPYSRSVVVSGFHLPALAICHLASAHKTIICASERFSLSLDVLSFSFPLSISGLSGPSKIRRRTQEKTHQPYVHTWMFRPTWLCVLPLIRNVCSPWVDFACSKLLARWLQFLLIHIMVVKESSLVLNISRSLLGSESASWDIHPLIFPGTYKPFFPVSQSHEALTASHHTMTLKPSVCNLLFMTPPGV